MSYTKEQYAAVHAPKCNMLVTAAAGAGKTHVLTGRIINRLTDPEKGVDVDRLLIVTFTKAAATEMRERIDAAITKEMERYPGSQRLSRQIVLLSGASITTIDAFCQHIVREYFYRLDLSPSFQMMDPAEEEVLVMEMAEDVMEELHKIEHPDFLAFTRAYSGVRSDQAVRDMILELYRATESVPFREEYLAKICAVYEGDSDGWNSRLATQARLLLEEAAEGALLAAKQLSASQYQDYFREAGIRLDSFIKENPSGETMGDFVRTETVFGKKPSVRGAEETEKKAFDRHREKLVSIIDDVKKLVGFSPEEAARRREELAPLARGLVAAVRLLIDTLKEEKEKRNAWSFADVERFCLDLLSAKDEDGNPCSSEVAQEIRERYDEIYIDEYQDSNHIQEWIFRLISGEWAGEPNMFMVGDLKQSIYRFRHSDPTLFREKKERYRREADEKYRKIELTRNFRSRSEVISGVNMLFRALMSTEAGEVEYDRSEELVFGSESYDFTPEGGNGCELLLIEKKRSEETEETEEKEAEELSAAEKEAVLIARRIQEMVESGYEIYDKEENCTRAVTYRDFAVLVRGMGKKAEAFSYIFDSYGIPLSAASPGGYYDTLEIRTFLALLGLIDNPRQDIPLAAVLRSAMVGMSEGNLSEIRCKDKKASLYDALCAAAKGEGALGDACRRFLERLNDWRERARKSGVDELVSYLFNETGWYAYVGALPGGDLRQANLRALYRKSAAYENHSGNGLFHFISAVEKSRAMGQDLEPARPQEGDLNVVQLMTIHKSKGLEFPVVFVASLGSQMNRQDTSGNLIIHPRLGIGLRFLDEVRHIRYTNPYREAIAHCLSREMISEELRILYVAATRAREKLIFTASVTGIQEKKEKWKTAVLSPGAVQRAKSYMDWIGPAVMQDEEKTFEVKIFPGKTLVPERKTLKKKEADAGTDCCTQEIREKLAFRYPFEPLADISPLFTVTELKGMEQKEEEDESAQLIKPNVLEPFTLEEKSGLSPMERGSVNHFVMQHLDVKEVFTAEDIRRKIEAMKEKDLLTETEAACADIGAMEQFISSPLCERMRRADEVHRESPFMMRLPCREVPGMEAGGDEMVVVQGIVDVWFKEGDRVVIVDYKTDRTGDVEEIKKRYRTQMDLYEKALSFKNLKKSSEKFIYLFYNGSIIEM